MSRRAPPLPRGQPPEAGGGLVDTLGPSGGKGERVPLSATPQTPYTVFPTMGQDIDDRRSRTIRPQSHWPLELVPPRIEGRPTSRKVRSLAQTSQRGVAPQPSGTGKKGHASGCYWRRANARARWPWQAGATVPRSLGPASPPPTTVGRRYHAEPAAAQDGPKARPDSPATWPGLLLRSDCARDPAA